MYPLQQEQCNAYYRVVREAPAIGRVYGCPQIRAAVLPAGRKAFSYQSFGC